VNACADRDCENKSIQASITVHLIFCRDKYRKAEAICKGLRSVSAGVFEVVPDTGGEIQHDEIPKNEDSIKNVLIQESICRN
jgi:hypothetical protein